MAFMQNVRLRVSTYYVVLNIPARARHAFGGKPQVWKSLRTKDKTEARNRAVPILAALESEVKAALVQTPSVVPATAQRIIVQRDQAVAAIERWRRATIQRSYDLHWNDAAPDWEPMSAEASALSETRYKLSVYDLDEVAEFYPNFSNALNTQGIGADAAHPVLPKLAREFADAWSNVERHVDRFRSGNFDYWPEEGERESPSEKAAAVAPPITAATPANTLRVMEAFEQWVAIEQPKEPERVRTYFKMLVSFLDDKPMADINHHDLDRFKLELRKYPLTKTDVSNLAFREVIAKFERDAPGYSRLSDTTIYGYWRHFNMVWTFAHGRRMVPFNPVPVVMPKKPSAGIRVKPYDAADIAAIFATPLFHGAAKMLDAKGRRYGYCATPGDVLVKDAHYWLPIFALWHGVRLEEIGGARVSELVKIGHRWAFDWTNRELKNESSARFVPIHRKLIELGFIDYIQSQPKHGFVFPELPHDPADEEGGTRQFSKWWGHWCAANAEVKGEGFDEARVKVFHSFRHSFKRQARGVIQESISDILSGHKGIASEGRKYGYGAEFDVLVEAIDKIDYPTFPALR